MTVSERIPFSGLLLPLQEGYTYSCDRRTTTDRFFLFRMTKPGVTLTGSPVTAIGDTETGNKEYWAKWEIGPQSIKQTSKRANFTKNSFLPDQERGRYCENEV